MRKGQDMTYEIFEGNMERLEKKLAMIGNKCRRYGCEFHYERVGEVFKDVEDEHGRKHIAKFILVKAEGTAVVNGWEFVASVEHTENGNIIKGTGNIEVPERYYVSGPVCEHCHSNRYRKYTYIVRNSRTGEFRQVGKSCLRDFTHGMSAEAITQYLSLFDTMVQGQAPEPGYAVEDYLDRDEYLAYVVETIRCFGYVKSGEEQQSTAYRALDYYDSARGNVNREYTKCLLEEMDRSGFDVHSGKVSAYVKDALDWIGRQQGHTNYIHNLKTACGLEYVSRRNVGLLASLFPAYGRAVENAERNNASGKAENSSRHVGTPGQALTFRANTVRCMTSYETQYGTKRIYKFIDTAGNVYIWKTGCVINETADVLVTGIVKEHTQFRDIKQTELTRCKVETDKL